MNLKGGHARRVVRYAHDLLERVGDGFRFQIVGCVVHVVLLIYWRRWNRVQRSSVLHIHVVISGGGTRRSLLMLTPATRDAVKPGSC